jgi:sn-glycerol 3-phosphate transport system permease protein
VKGSRLLAWACLLPTLFVLAVFIGYPAIDSLYLSFQDVDGFTRATTFIGSENYRQLFESPDYWSSVRVSVWFTLYTVIPSVLLALGIALALDATPFFHSLFRTVFLLPVSISSAMAAMLWIFFYNPTAGYLNYLLSLLGIDGPHWLVDPKWALPAVAIATVWKEIGFNVIFFLAGLAGVPPELREAATIDGANAWQRFRHVILPILSPTLLFVLVVSVIHSFESFGQIHILTRGGPAGTTNVLVYNLYRDGFENFLSGYASAQAVVLFLVILSITALQFWIARKRVHYGR